MNLREKVELIQSVIDSSNNLFLYTNGTRTEITPTSVDSAFKGDQAKMIYDTTNSSGVSVLIKPADIRQS